MRKQAIAILWGAAFAYCGTGSSAAEGIDSARAQELVRLVRQDCGSCHGLLLKGGLGPSLLPNALRAKPVQSLRATILVGRPGTAMPPWQGILSETEADWILKQLLAGFPREAAR